MKFHFNEVALRHTAQSRLPDREGRLQYRSSKGGYKERWFRLQGNLLFYFRTNEFGSIADHDPLGVFVLAQFSVEMEPISDRPFVFTVTFAGEEGRKHYFSGQTMQQCREWIDALQRNSYEAVRMKFESIRREVQRLTGKDPINEKMTSSIKQKAKLPAFGQDSRRTKFYYDDGGSSKCDVVAASSAAPTEKPVRPPEASQTRLVGPMDSALAPRSNVAMPSQDKSLVDEVLVSLSLEDGGVPSITQIPQTATQLEIGQVPLLSRGISPMPLVQLDVTQMLTPQSGKSNIQHEQLGNMSQMPGISSMLLGKPVVSQMAFIQPGISQLTLVQAGLPQMSLFHSGISRMPPALSGGSQVPGFQPISTQMPLVQSSNSQLSTAQSGIFEIPLLQPGINQLSPMQSGVSQMPSVQPGISQMPAARPGISKMPSVQQGINQLSLIQLGGSQLPVMHPGVSQTPLQPDASSMLMATASTMQIPLTMRPRSAQASEIHKRNAIRKPHASSDEKFQMHKSHTHDMSESNAVNCWPLQSLQRMGKSHTTPELTSFEKWEKFDD